MEILKFTKKNWSYIVSAIGIIYLLGGSAQRINADEFQLNNNTDAIAKLQEDITDIKITSATSLGIEKANSNDTKWIMNRLK